MRIVLAGYGRMGHLIESMAQERGHEVIGHVDITNTEDWQTMPAADVVLDFSNPGMLRPLADYIRRTGAALVEGTTGYSEEDLALLHSLAEYAPVIHSANYSLGVAVFRHLLQQIPASVRDSFDIEILEKHHRHKIDAPSGTAKQLLAAVDPEHRRKVVTGREGIVGERTHDEIGVMALRGGSVAGEHTVYFFGEDETLAITHTASSRRIFAGGALQTAEKLCGREKGLYQLDDLIFG
ncbi:MAG: 4-hydroxy-tetrahydrodipicolinate reductase [Firmicutes bacterium]|nr:4-hydroxy-tetrahydrodipicolinate reductase [Bacillota bacterium]